MSISGPASYLPTADEFLAHWLAADTLLGAGNEIVLPGPVLRAGLQTARDALEAKRADVAAKLNVQEVARGDVEVKKAAAHLRINQFKEKVLALYPGSKWERALPRIPGLSEGQGNFVGPLDDMSTLWVLMNANVAIPDVTLLGAYTQVLFAAELVALKTAYVAYNGGQTVSTITREERNDLQDSIYQILKNYRQSLPTYFAKGHALVESVPRLTPEPGSTPDAVTAGGVWDAVLLKAKITWTQSTAADLFQYEIRFCAGPTYDTDTESVIGNVTPAAPREFFTDAGLAAAGNVASFKVYVVTATGNEKGSNTLSLTRPA
jgi:hypothetical protein